MAKAAPRTKVARKKATKPPPRQKPTKSAPGTREPPAPRKATKAAPRKPTPAPRKATKPAPRKATKPAPRKAKPAPAKATRRARGRVVEILDARRPVVALRQFLTRLPRGPITIPDGQVALGAAQLLLLPIARDQRGGQEVHAILDLILDRWARFPDRDGFHAQELLRNAFATVGDDPDRLAALVALVPATPSPELLFTIATAHAVVGDRDAMLHAVRAALAAGVSAKQLRGDPDLASFAEDPALRELLGGVRAPAIPVDIAPFVPSVRAALATLRRTLENFGEPIEINDPADLRAVLETERTAQLQFPNDLRALLTIADGATLYDARFLSLADYQTTPPWRDGCIPVANWGKPDHWLLYDPHGTVRRGGPGYILILGADARPLADLRAAIDWLTASARDVLATN